MREPRSLLPQIVPAVGVEDGFVEIVVDLLEDGDEALVVDVAFLVGQGFPGAELFEDVVDPRQGQVGMELLLPLAMRVETFAEVADALSGGGVRVREGEGFEAAGVVVAWVVAFAHPSAGG
ncbi:MAG: hypothetical protein P1U85_04390 [Verrucomicrobiales bacterium]|nr:hypothetical protein [Verrucomicrobiales bacterium]